MTNKLYIGNLPFTAEEQHLREVFGSDGRAVTSVKIMLDRETGRSRGFAFVEMATPEDAQKAIQALHGKEFMGRPLTVNEAREQPPRGAGFGGPPRPFNGPRPNGGGGFNGPPRPSGGFGGPRPGSPPPVEEPTPERGPSRANRERGKDRDRDRRNRGGKGDDWS